MTFTSGMASGGKVGLTHGRTYLKSSSSSSVEEFDPPGVARMCAHHSPPVRPVLALRCREQRGRQSCATRKTGTNALCAPRHWAQSSCCIEEAGLHRHRHKCGQRHNAEAMVFANDNSMIPFLFDKTNPTDRQGLTATLVAPPRGSPQACGGRHASRAKSSVLTRQIQLHDPRMDGHHVANVPRRSQSNMKPKNHDWRWRGLVGSAPPWLPLHSGPTHLTLETPSLAVAS